MCWYSMLVCRDFAHFRYSSSSALLKKTKIRAIQLVTHLLRLVNAGTNVPNLSVFEHVVSWLYRKPVTVTGTFI